MINNNSISKKHQKKRNTGLLYEFLIRYISNALIENKDKDANFGIKLLKHYFKKGTELYKEFRLFNALVKTTVDSDGVAASILHETKKQSRKYDFKKLDREKSLLIRDINHKLADPMFFNRRIDEYKLYATIQTLLNDWRNNNFDNIERVAVYENEVVRWLLNQEKNLNENKDLEEEKNTNVDALVVKLMIEKINKKYSSTLNNEQRTLIKQYAFAIEYGDKTQLIEATKNIINETLAICKKYISENKNDPILLNKFTKAQELMEVDLNRNQLDDQIIINCLKYSKLKEELNTVEEKESDEINHEDNTTNIVPQKELI